MDSKKADGLKDAIELCQQSQTTDAVLNVFTKAFEMAAGVGVDLFVEGIAIVIQKMGLDRVFDSLRTDKSFEKYAREKRGKNGT